MAKLFINSCVMVFVLTLLTGVAYPLAMTGLAQVLFPRQANGSLIIKHGEAVGSALIGQSFTSPNYFHSRPSAAGADGYDAAASGGSNLGPTSVLLKENVTKRLAEVRRDNNLSEQALIPSDLVLTSASGLDPHITPAAAAVQIERVAGTRNMETDELRALVDQYTEGRQWGILGEPRVNVLELNIALLRL